jgi:hypothetical protein
MAALPNDLLGSGMPPRQAALLGDSIRTLAGDTNTQSTTSIIYEGEFCLVTSGFTNQAVRLDTNFPIGGVVTVFSLSSSGVRVFPPIGCSIDGISVNGSVSVVQLRARQIRRVSVTLFLTLAGAA